MLGDLNPQTIKIDQQAVVYPGRDHVTTLTIKRFDGRSYRPVDTSALTRVVLVFPDTDPTIAYDSDTLPAVFDWTGSTITIDLSDYAMPASSLPCYLIAFDVEHPAGQVLVDNEDTTLEFDFRNVSTTGNTPAPAVEFITDAPIDGETYGRKDGAWVTLEALISGVASVNGQSGIVVLDSDDIAEGATNEYYTDAKASAAAPVQSVNGQTGVVTLDAADVGADPAGEAAAEVALHEAALDPHPQYTTAGEAAAAAPVQSVNGETGAVVLDAADVGADASGAAAAAVAAHVGEADPHTQYQTQAESDARYERGLVAGTNVTIDRTNPAAPVISAAGGGGGAVDSVNGQTGTVVLDADDIAEGATNHYYPAADESKLAGIESGAQVNVATDIAQSTRTATTVLITSSTGADATLTAASTTEAGLQTAADKTKLDGIATGATQNSSDGFLLARANHTGTQTASTISDFASASRAQTEAELIAGTNVTITPAGSGATRTLTIAASGGGATLPVVQALSSTRNLVLADINTFNVNSTVNNYTATIPPQSSVTWTADAEIHFLPSNTGDITITAAAGVSLNGVVAGSVTLSTQNGAASIKRKAADSWWVGGAIGTQAEQRAALGVPDAFGNRNRIINGNFSVNQLPVSGSVVLAAGAYGHDGWKAGASGCTYTFATSNNITTLTISAGSLQQVVEGLNLQSGTHALSWSGTAQGKIDGGSYSASGVTGTATGGTNLTVEFNIGTLSLVQLEFGSVATAFEHRPIGTELSSCQRYYETGKLDARCDGVMAYVTASTAFSVPKMASPTFVVRDNTGAAGFCSIDATNGVPAIITGDSRYVTCLINNTVGANNTGPTFNWSASARL